MKFSFKKLINAPAKIACIVCVFMGIIFAVVGISFTGEFAKANEMQQIHDTGADGLGYNVQMFSGGVRIENESYFYLTFNYIDGNGVEKSGKTATTYTQSQAANLVMQNKIEIVFNENGAVDKAFDKDQATKMNKIMVAVFCGIAVVFVFAGGMLFMRAPRNASVMQHGVETQAIVEDVVGGVSINGVEYYKVKLSYTNERGEHQIGSTAHDYTFDKINNYPIGKSVRIKYRGKSAVILDEME